MSQSEIDQGLRTRLYWGASLSTGLLGLISLLTQRYDAAIIALIFSAFMILITQLQRRNVASPYLKTISFLMIGFLCLATLAGPFWGGELGESWSYVFPVILFFILPVKTALICAGVYTAVYLTLIMHYYPGPAKPQLLISYLFCL